MLKLVTLAKIQMNILYTHAHTQSIVKYRPKIAYTYMYVFISVFSSTLYVQVNMTKVYNMLVRVYCVPFVLHHSHVDYSDVYTTGLRVL